ncbi:MAG: histidine kinase [Bacteroidota bacterium]
MTNILPIILALILPLVRLYSIGDEEITLNFSLIVLWLYSSLILYFLWYFFWQLWEIRKGNKKWYAMALFGVLTGLVFIYVKSFGTIIDVGTFDISSIKILPPVILFLTIQYVLQSQRKTSRIFLEKERLQTENFKSQLQVLQAKIDPHFLFNSLNTLRSMVRQTHENSEQFILSLSDFYRQTLTYNENTQLQLSEELKVLESYLFLMKNRNEDAIKVKFNIDESLHSFLLPTLALQIVVENCFKHNSMTASMPLYIEISSTDDGYIEVKNNLQPKFGEVESTGFGLSNLEKRYELMGISQGIIIAPSDQHFTIRLKLIK